MLIVENNKKIVRIREKFRLMEEKNDVMRPSLRPFNVTIESASPFKLKKINVNTFYNFSDILNLTSKLDGDNERK